MPQTNAQAQPAKAPAPVAAAAAPVTEKDAAAVQDQLIKLLRQSPKLTTIVAREAPKVADLTRAHVAD